MAYLSDFLKNGSTLSGKAGSLAINANDLLLLNQQGQLYSANVSDYAAVGNSGVAIIAATTVNAASVAISARKEVFINPLDASIFIVAPSSGGLSIYKYSSAGTLLESLLIDISSTGNVIVSQLSNGNLVIGWGADTGSLVFTITDVNLSIIVTKVTVVAASLLGQAFDLIPLSGGGFAISYGLSTGVYSAIYTNAGGVTYAPTLIAGTPTAGMAVKMAQLSNGNIAIAINSSVASNAIGHAIMSVTGTSVLAYTALSATTGTAYFYPEIQIVNGFYCVAGWAGATAATCVAYVLNNAGVLQGAPYSIAASGITLSSLYKLLSDGTNFEFLCRSGTSQAIAFIPITGTGYVTTTLAALAGAPIDAFFDNRGFLVYSEGSATWVLEVLASGVVMLLYSLTAMTGLGTFNYITVKPTGDFSLLILILDATAGATIFGVQKYMNTAIVGVAQSTIAAGNAGTNVSYSMGPGGYPCNQVLGTVGKGFDHSATNIVGNKGTMLGGGISLKGI